MDESTLAALSIVAGFSATLLGVIIGFELERHRDTQARKERLVGALQMIRDEIDRNVSLCKQIHEELSSNPGFIQYYTLKTTIWQAVSSALVDLKSPNLTKQIANEYFDYEHLKRRIDARFEFFKSGYPSNVMQSKAFEAVTGSVIVGVKTLQISGKNVLESIDKQLNELKS
jgi:hypothetical protein